MALKHLSIAIICYLSLVAAIGCTGTPAGSGSTGGTASSAAEIITGNYTLISVDSQSIPARVTHDSTGILIHSGGFIIRPDGTCSSSTVYTSPRARRLTQTVHARCKFRGAQLLLRWQGAGKTTASFDGDRFTMDNHGMAFVYSRTASVDDDSVLDLAGECDRGAAGPSAAAPGVFDDFESGLQAGHNRNGMPLGFLTFQDSARSFVRISVISEHPALADEAAGNQVLRLEFRVESWGGAVHNFANPALSRWSPRDWRGFSGMSFWFYGRNRGNELFVDILDNRNSCPKPGGAEVYTTSFRDNFSGWQRVSIPFDGLRRKEIHNGAPNDGLGLGEVHGWALGALNTGGPVTYYVDDLALY